MQAAPLSGECYEDYCGDAMLLDRFPYVGSWLQIHFVIHLFSQVGEQILWALGERSREWLILREVSGGVRIAMSLAVAEVMRRGPYTIRFSSPQWLAAIDEYLLTGYPVCGGVGPSSETAPPLGGGGLAPVFPYLEGPPGIVAHYLWRVFLLVGWLVLDLLGDRVASWGYLRSVAGGFRSSTTMAVAIWLRRTGQRYVELYAAPTPAVADAAAAYMRDGELRFPFDARNEEVQDFGDDGEIDERPIRPRVGPGPVGMRFEPIGQGLLGESSSESDSGDSGDSTTEPSVFSASQDSSREDLEVEQVQAEAVEGNQEGAVGAGRGPSCQASEGVSLCAYGDDVLTVPLQGWTVSEVATVVLGLQTGDWTSFQQMMAEAPTLSASPSSSVDPPTVVRPRLRLKSGVVGLTRVLRGVFWMFLFFWVGIQSARAQEGKEGQSVVLWEPSEGCCAGLSVQVSAERGSAVLSETGTGCDGTVLWELAKAFFVDRDLGICSSSPRSS